MTLLDNHVIASEICRETARIDLFIHHKLCFVKVLKKNQAISFPINIYISSLKVAIFEVDEMDTLKVPLC